ncbi:hypothetical protein HXX76_005280 [Chlamydomonas incerta]|uniref:Uncharacterized protein n=1 Tax=Chlamydomonas incerta TaxID=51695 RepID=A0A835THC5_CHLIN|nr:hypothetical protein HXX76_005280 [Chlamydomonas incerta]|eukprot:KAG2438735.1 hypothetical protein HXX76_005280 [Chlamydomonas incerta]
MACGKCWMTASGGTVDGSASKPHYRYGGLWKNHHQNKSGRNKVPAAAKATAPGKDSGTESRSGSDAEDGGELRPGDKTCAVVATGSGDAGMQAELLREAADCDAEDKVAVAEI